MTRSNIPIEIRRCAMWCHFLNLLWLFIIIAAIAIFTTFSNLVRDEGTAILIILLLPPLSLVFARILSLIFWLLNRQRHPFIEEAGKEAMNFSLSIDLYVLTIGAISLASCGLYAVNPLFSSIGIIRLLVPVLLLVHFCLVLFGGIQASQGTIYKYPLTVRFFR